MEVQVRIPCEECLGSGNPKDGVGPICKVCVGYGFSFKWLALELDRENSADPNVGLRYVIVEPREGSDEAE